MSRTRLIAIAIAFVSLAVLLFSSYTLATRIRAYIETQDFPVHYFVPVGRQNIEFAGREVRLSDRLDEDGNGVIIVEYGDNTLEIPVTTPVRYQVLPFYERHRDWFSVQIFAEASGLDYGDFDEMVRSGDILPRLVFVARQPFGLEAEPGRFNLEQEKSWGVGEVRRDLWTFDFYEAMPDGGFREELGLKYPESGKSFERRRNYADLRGEPEPVRDPDELKERSWQYQAALSVMPRKPQITAETQALRNAGWTLPVASVSVIVLLFSAGFAVFGGVKVERPPAAGG